MNTNDGGPAYPVKWVNWHNQYVSCLTIRDHFAGLAMAALITAHRDTLSLSTISESAYSCADAMLRAREAGQ